MKLNEIHYTDQMDPVSDQDREKVRYSDVEQWKKAVKEHGKVYKSFDSSDLEAKAGIGGETRVIGRWDSKKGEGYIINKYVQKSNN